MKLRNILLITLFLLSLAVQSQNPGFGFNPYSSPSTYPGMSQSLSPVKFNLQTGATFTSVPGGGSLFNTFMAPSFSQPVTKKLTLTAGAVISHSTYSNLGVINAEGNFAKVSGNTTNMTIYASGAYQVNDKLTLSGSAYKTINPAFNARLSPNQLQMEAQGMSFGIGYKVGENMHIGAEIRMQQGGNNYYSPFGLPGISTFNNGFNTY